MPCIGRQRAIELSFDTQSIRVRRCAPVPHVKLCVVAGVIKRISLKQGPPLTAARGRKHYVHNQRVLIHKMPASIRARAMTHVKTLCGAIASKRHDAGRLPIDIQRWKAGDVRRISLILQIRSNCRPQIAPAEVPLSRDCEFIDRQRSSGT